MIFLASSVDSDFGQNQAFLRGLKYFSKNFHSLSHIHNMELPPLLSRRSFRKFTSFSSSRLLDVDPGRFHGGNSKKHDFWGTLLALAERLIHDAKTCVSRFDHSGGSVRKRPDGGRIWIIESAGSKSPLLAKPSKKFGPARSANTAGEPSPDAPRPERTL
jgi:hypothetical protein